MDQNAVNRVCEDAIELCEWADRLCKVNEAEGRWLGLSIAVRVRAKQLRQAANALDGVTTDDNGGNDDEH